MEISLFRQQKGMLSYKSESKNSKTKVDKYESNQSALKTKQFSK